LETIGHREQLTTMWYQAERHWTVNWPCSGAHGVAGQVASLTREFRRCRSSVPRSSLATQSAQGNAVRTVKGSGPGGPDSAGAFRNPDVLKLRLRYSLVSPCQVWRFPSAAGASTFAVPFIVSEAVSPLLTEEGRTIDWVLSRYHRIPRDATRPFHPRTRSSFQTPQTPG
jgi:hypothetical protein